MRQTFNNYCKKYILDHIDEYEHSEHYSSDFCMTITEDINSNPSLYFSRENAFSALKAWMEEAAAYWDYEKWSFGEHIHNPFEKPECYIACMIIENISGMLGRCPLLERNWNDQISLSNKNIRQIKSYVRSVKQEHFF